MSKSGNVASIWVINLLFEYSWYVLMLLLSIVVFAYVLTIKVHFGPTRTVSTTLDSLPLTSDSCDLIQNSTTPNSSFARLHSAGVSSPDTTSIGLPRTLPYHSTDANQMQHTSFIRKHKPPQLPKFSLNNSQGYFLIIELLLTESHITSEHTKFAMLAIALSHGNKVMQMISDAWPQINSNEPFTTLKNVLLKRFSPKNQDGLESFFSETQRQGDTVTEYLIRLQALLSSQFPTNSEIGQALIRRKLLESVDAQTRLTLYPYEKEPLEILAQHADSILARKQSFVAGEDVDHNAQNPTNQAIINQMLESRLDKLDCTLSSLHQTSPPSPHKYTHTLSQPHKHVPQHTMDSSPFSPNQSPTRPVNNVCSYHHRCGDRAIKCWGPSCPMYQQNQATKRQVDLHELGALRSYFSESSPLLFVRDSCYNQGCRSAKILPLPHRLFDLKSNLAKKFCPFPNVN